MRRRARPYIITIPASKPSEGRPGSRQPASSVQGQDLACALSAARKRASHVGNQHATIVNRAYAQETKKKSYRRNTIKACAQASSRPRLEGQVEETRFVRACVSQEYGRSRLLRGRFMMCTGIIIFLFSIPVLIILKNLVSSSRAVTL